jgi:DNA-3-methyladenine glycosylase II
MAATHGSSNGRRLAPAGNPGNGWAASPVPAHVTPDVRLTLTQDLLAVAVRDLAAQDGVLGRIVGRFGPPPLWDRPAGFPTLVHIILEQQVSLASAAAAFGRLQARLDPPTPAGLLGLTDQELLAIGFSRQKARYARALAAAIRDGTLDLDGLAALDDDAVDRELFAVPGIGPWTATIYRLMVLRRPDAWPAADIALAQSLAEAGGLDRRPSPDEMTAFAEAWRPRRAVAARILWHGYIETRAARRRGVPPTTSN